MPDNFYCILFFLVNEHKIFILIHRLSLEPQIFFSQHTLSNEGDTVFTSSTEAVPPPFYFLFFPYHEKSQVFSGISFSIIFHIIYMVYSH